MRARRPGVIVLGDDRGGRVLRVCIQKKRCTKHWGQRTSAADRTDQGARAKAEADRVAKERSRAERERVYWDAELRPALLKAIAQKARHSKITRTLVVTVAEAITGRHAELAKWCASLSTVDADRFAQVLVMALALNDVFSQHRADGPRQEPPDRREGPSADAEDGGG